MRKKTWQKILTEVITDPYELSQALQLPVALFAQTTFPLKVPRRWLQKIRSGDRSDPLLLQVLPQQAELLETALFQRDPLQEKSVNPLPGLLHKYQSRALLIVTGACAVHCRYCFRREFPYSENQTGQRQWDEVIAYLNAHPEINEIILSGGDPLLAPDSVLAGLVEKISAISHVKTLRIHTRMPVTIPERLDKDFLAWFDTGRFMPVIVIHVNHPNEIDARFCKKMQQLKKRGIVLYNQTVLLKNINDDVSVLKALSEKLFFEAGVQPYYLHLLDKVKGAAHFDLPEEEAKKIYKELQAKLPGYLVPKLVREVPGERNKVLG